MFEAVYKDDLSAVKAAIVQGANLDARDSTDTKPEDIAIDRGNFDIAHLLISTRNQRQAQKDEVLASAEKPGSREIERVSKVRKVVNTASPSAAKRFFSTFLDFFKPPNTTGIVERSGAVSRSGNDAARDAALQKQIQNSKAKRAAAAINTTPPPVETEQAPLREPSAAPSRNLPLITTGSDALPVPTSASAVPTALPQADTANRVLASQKPFNGGVDPDIVALLAENSTKQQKTAKRTANTAAVQNPFAAPPADNPFAAPASAPAREVAVLKAKRPSPPEANDPFAASARNNPFAANEKTAKPDGWDVKSVDRAKTPQILPALSDIKSAGVVLEGANFKLGSDIAIGQKISKQQLKTLKEKTIYRPCFSRNGEETVFCVDKINWPFDLEENFQVDTIMYQGTRAIVRYDAGRATNLFTLFKTEAFAKVVGYYTKRYGSPTKIMQRSIAPLAAPRRDNPTYIWKSKEPGTDAMTALEIRKYDDVRGGFPDTERGVIMLYRVHSGRIFPQLSQLELMVMRDDGSSNPKSQIPGNIWNAKP